jgi:hypothetical protein
MGENLRLHCWCSREKEGATGTIPEADIATN